MSLTTSDVEKCVREIVADICGVDRDHPEMLDADYVKTGFADSLDVVEIVMAIEEDFGVMFADEFFESVGNTLRPIIVEVERLLRLDGR